MAKPAHPDYHWEGAALDLDAYLTRIDFTVANDFTSTSPRSPFVTRPYIQRMRPESHHILDATTWITEYLDGSAQTQHVEPADLPKLLTEVFDIDLTPHDAATLSAAPWAGN
jgi:N-hydroxyarylamine O-acetyltransferase